MTNFSNLIIDYLDEGLDSQSEVQLFQELTHSEELRVEFYNEIKMMRAIEAENKVLAPPIMLTNQIFNTLGFAIPTAALVNTASRVQGSVWTTMAIAITTFFRDNLATIASFVIGSSLAVALMLGLNGGKSNTLQESGKNTNPTVNQNQNQQNNQTPPTVALAPMQNETQKGKEAAKTEKKSRKIPVSNSQEVATLANKSDKANTIKTIVTNDRASLLAELQKLSSEEKTKVIETLTENRSSLISELQNSENNKTQNSITNADLITQNVNLSNNNNLQKAETIKPITTKLEESDLQLRITGLTNMSGSSLVSGLNNLSIGGMYRISDFYKLGFDIGRESFNLQSTDKSIGMEKKDLMYFTFSNRFDTREYFSLFSGSLYPIAEIKLGATNGFIAKSQLGFEFTPENRTSMFVGYEYGYLYYTNSKNWYSTNKSSLVFGISYNF